MKMKVNVRRLDGSLESVELVFNSCVAIGYAGRDQQSVRLHVEELAKLGVPRPTSIPSMYWVSPDAIECTDQIQVVGEETSAEIEFFMAPDAEGRLYVTVVSDHSDRKLESVSVSKAKQICPKIIGPEFWVLDDVKDHWDDLQLTCHAWLPDRQLYQDASVSSLLDWEKLLELQRCLARDRDVIMDGRDIGTNILPDADVKIYLTASVETRAKRRYDELMEKGETCELESIARDIRERDERDMTREIAPLKQAEDAVLVDSSDMTIQEVVDTICSYCK